MKKHKQGHFISLGLLWGVPLGVVFGTIFKNMAFIGIGIPIGLSIGAAIEESYKKKGLIIPADEKAIAKEKRQTKRVLQIGGLLLFVLIVWILVVLFT